MVNLGDIFPNFDVETTHGSFKLHDWLGDQWGIILSHPADYTPVCTSELGQAAKLYEEFMKRNTKLIGLSCDNVESHHGWIKDIMAYHDLKEDWPYPIIADPKRELAVYLGMLDPVEVDEAGVPMTCRSVFFIGADKKLKASILYPATTGRSFDEILRVLNSLQLTSLHKIATPCDWKWGESCMILPSVSKEEADKNFPGYSKIEVPSGKSYLRITSQPVT